MHSAAVFVVSAFAATALAQAPTLDASLAFIPPSTAADSPPVPSTVSISATQTVYYKPLDSLSDSPVTIEVLTGCPNMCHPVSTATATGGVFSWVVDGHVGCDYGLEILQGNSFDYSNNFCVGGDASDDTTTTTDMPGGYGYGHPTSKPTYGKPPPVYGGAPVSTPTTHAPAGPGSYKPYTHPKPTYTPTPTPVYTPSRYTPGPMYTGAAAQAKIGAGAMGLAGLVGVAALL